MNPVQAADMSKATAPLFSIFDWTLQAVDGKKASGVAVATTIRSISSGVAFPSRALRAASAAMSEVVSPSLIRLSFIPVLVVIHWSEVSTIFSRSKFVRALSGT